MVYGYPYDENIINQGFKRFAIYFTHFFFPKYRYGKSKRWFLFSMPFILHKYKPNDPFELTRRELYSNWINKREHFHLLVLRSISTKYRS